MAAYAHSTDRFSRSTAALAPPPFGALAPEPQPGPITLAIRANEREHDPSRRTMFGALAVLPLLGVPANAEAPSELARACDWASAHWTYVNNPLRGESFDDDRLDAEIDRYDDVFWRAISEPSRTRADVVAKARLLLGDYELGLFPYRDPEKNAQNDADLSGQERLIRVVLREVITGFAA